MEPKETVEFGRIRVSRMSLCAGHFQVSRKATDVLEKLFRRILERKSEALRSGRKKHLLKVTVREKRGPGRPPFLLNAWVGLKSFSEKESLIFFVELLLIINEFSNQEKALVLVLHYGHLEARAESL